jgi:hypothetical protein
MYNITIICCLKKKQTPFNTIHLGITKLSEMLSAINVCRHYRHYISVKSCSGKALNSLISLQNEVYAFKARKVKQIKLSNFFKARLSSKNISIFF